MNWIIYAGRVLHRSVRWMSWNLFLAFVPLVLSVWLFRLSRSRSLLWWIGVLVFIAFLPNAPYVLTDVIHLIAQIREGESIWVVTLLLIPQYLAFMLAGFGAYVLSLINVGRYLAEQGKARWIGAAELSMHALSAVGVYLGRFERFNSWDFVTQPDAVVFSTIDNLAHKRPVLVIVITFAVITGLYWIMKQLCLGILLRARQRMKANRHRARSQSSQLQ
ncbi:DUF1361 domain-containing protein [Oculatella sp. LEGE 06141]|uniref:DUF1361 domain-containing protein n=1 Tax=Oculatella sp. LEGE 06141 TaxID=1828648 RepID=UPI001881F333|nr:DUF1361 domain-containing protein [Oculatella sp. LEGE 06141]MBE9179012.1 DUF1361 domain-containing protein [Oculatella sp. LEGE 06141]